MQTLIPAWVVAYIAAIVALAVAVNLASAGGSSAKPVVRATVNWAGICNGAWQIMYTSNDRNSFTARTVSSESAIRPACALPIAAGNNAVNVHAGGTSAVLQVDSDVEPLVAGGYFSVPVSFSGDRLYIQPTGAGNLTLTVWPDSPEGTLPRIWAGADAASAQ
jgi:hypothetical protein